MLLSCSCEEVLVKLNVVLLGPVPRAWLPRVFNCKLGRILISQIWMTEGGSVLPFGSLSLGSLASWPTQLQMWQMSSRNLLCVWHSSSLQFCYFSPNKQKKSRILLVSLLLRKGLLLLCYRSSLDFQPQGAPRFTKYPRWKVSPDQFTTPSRDFIMLAYFILGSAPQSSLCFLSITRLCDISLYLSEAFNLAL